MLSTIDYLRQIARCCQAGQVLDADLSHWLGASLDRFLQRQCQTIEDAMGLRAPRGGVPWWLEEAMRRRDAALRELAERHLPALAPSGQARQIHLRALRYGASAWNHDQAAADMPTRYSGKPNEWLWRAFKSGAPMPICERQLRNILGR